MVRLTIRPSPLFVLVSIVFYLAPRDLRPSGTGRTCASTSSPRRGGWKVLRRPWWPWIKEKGSTMKRSWPRWIPYSKKPGGDLKTQWSPQARQDLREIYLRIHWASEILPLIDGKPLARHGCDPEYPCDQPLIREHFHADARNAIHFQLPRRRSGKIDNPAALVGSTVVYAHDNLPAIGKIRDPDLGPKRQMGVGRGKGILIKGLTTGGFLAVVFGSVPGRHAVLLFACRTTAASKRDRKDHSHQEQTANHGASNKQLEASRWPVSDPDLETSPVNGESRK